MCGSAEEDCHKFATCADTGPGTYKCTCNEGYTGDGKISCTGLKKVFLTLSPMRMWVPSFPHLFQQCLFF